MTSNEHKKHTILEKPKRGDFGRLEYALIGAPCSLIQKLSDHLIEALSQDHHAIYVDADHAGHDEQPQKLNHDILTDKIGFYRYDKSATPNSHDLKQDLWNVDVAIVNGNHFKADQQIIILNSKKEESLSRKMDRLNNVRLIIKDDVEKPFDFLEQIPGIESVPIISIDDKSGIVQYLKEDLANNNPEIYGLVLAGGKSQRMGHDKARIEYHGKSQLEYTAELMEGTDQNFYSCRPNQEKFWQSDYPVIHDKFLDMGPFGAILSAFQKYPNNAWLVVACDIPLIDRDTIRYLLENRNPSKVATAFYNPETKFPEPLITLWEPKAYPRLLQFMAQGYSCPRKVLINSDIEMLYLEDASVLRNVNNPQELEEVKKILQK